MATLSEIMSESFAVSARGTFKKIPQWAGLALITLIIVGAFSLLTGLFDLPVIELGSALGIVILVVGIIFSIHYSGVFANILRGEEKYLARCGRTFWEGFKFTIVGIIYTIIPLIVGIFLYWGFAVGIDLLITPEQEFIYYAGIIFAIIIEVIIAVFFTLFWLPGMLAFAKTGKITKAFNFFTLDEMINSIGWKKFICGYLILIVINLLLFFILLILTLLVAYIPVAGGIISLVLFAIFYPYIWVYTGVFVSKLFEVNPNEN